MKVSFYKNVDIEGEVSVSVEDIQAALAEAFPDEDAIKQRYGVTMFVNAVYQCLLGLTDKMIESISAKNRRIIVEKLSEQADRFKVDTGDRK